MPIIIKREETVRLARTLKQKTGMPMTRVIHAALEEHMKHLGNAGADRARQLAEMRSISRRIARLPERDPRSADDIVGYDENGLPS
ncbi:type II toxin-antitoxin system VapB family antitoxin [Mesorhizobium sp.]|jgi:antitoxin VapB|uniref:type II toxin-antitoxin system VapB family antitoxin n=1 Tax=Mesorhizobium sp. TaxID=1871066 RepID=UPI003561483E